MPPSPFGPSTGGAGPDAPPTAWERLSRTFLRPPGPGPAPRSGQPLPDVSRMTDDEKRTHIVRLGPTERKVGLAASAIAAVAALAYYLPFMVSHIVVTTTVKPNHKRCPTAAGVRDLKYAVTAGKDVCRGIYTTSHYVFPLVVILVLALAIYVTVRIRRRAPVAFSIIMTGLAFGSIYLFVPFAAAGGWIMLRAWRTQKYGAPNVKSRLDGWVAPPPRGTTRRPVSQGPGRSRRSRGKDQTPPARKAPTQNKRYTPKAPPKKKATPPARS